MRPRTVMLCMGTLALAAACGSRTGLLAPGSENAADAAADVTPFPVGPSDCPDAGRTLIYLIWKHSDLI